MIFSIGRVVYIYNLASFRDLDSVHCGGRPILAPPFELPVTELGDATSAMTRLCGAQKRTGGPTRLIKWVRCLRSERSSINITMEGGGRRKDFGLVDQ